MALVQALVIRVKNIILMLNLMNQLKKEKTFCKIIKINQDII